MSPPRKRTARACKPGASSQDPEEPVSIEAEYRGAVVRAVILAARLLSSKGGGPVGRRRLINFLRGNQLPRPATGVDATDECFGLLEGHRDEWIREIVDHLVETGYLLLEPRSRGLPPGISVGPAGLEVLSREGCLPREVFPVRPRLGQNPELEEKLRSLRRDLARAEGRTPFGIFPNVVLATLATRRPANLAALADIPGLGQARIRKYGRRILAAIKA